MFFRRRKSHYQRGWGWGISRIFRLILSLLVLAILGVGLFQAYKTFSGFDPLKLNPQTLTNLLSSQSVYSLITGLLTLNPGQSIDQNRSNTSTSASKLTFKFGVVADSHLDTQNLSKALSQAKSLGAKFVIGLGDFSDIGTTQELKISKQKFDEANLDYYVISGDHDLWESRNKGVEATANFTEVFGKPPYSSFSFENTRIILINNSDNYLGLDELQLKWIEETLDSVEEQGPKPVFVFASTPLYHPSSDHVMGKENTKLKNQAEHLSSIFKKHGVAEVIAGDTHSFSRYREPINDLPMTSIGAVTSARNPQAPRFAMIEILQDGSYNIEDTEIR